MRTMVISDPAVPGANEDAAGALGEVAVVIDGAGVPARFRAGCHHSVAWYSHHLAARLLTRALDPGTDLPGALRGAIVDVRDLHVGACDLDAGGPSATVVAARIRDEHLEHLVLSDSSLLLERADGTTRRLTDTRVEDVARTERTPEEVEAKRNAPGGFWVARHEPEAADQARCGQVPRAELRAAHLVSDGITRAVDLLGLHTDATLAGALAADPGAAIAALRTAEGELPPARRPRKLHDDATVLTLTL